MFPFSYKSEVHHSCVEVEDGSGWWNLMRHQNPCDPSQSWERLWPMQAETAMPQWVFGMSTTAWDGEQLLAAVCADGRWQLKRLSADGAVSLVDQPFDDLAELDADAGRAVAIASNSTTGQGLCMGLQGGIARRVHTSALFS